MDTMTTEKKKRLRRNHTLALKAQILAECEVPGASVARVALAHGINANIVHGWRKLARGLNPLPTPAFVPVTLAAAQPTPAPASHIDIELQRGALSVRIAWPASAAAEMTVWMRELLR